MAKIDETEPVSPIRWEEDHLELLDQTRLPREESWLRCTEPEDVADAIRRLAVRGAPAIGVAAAYGLVLGMTGTGARGAEEQRARFDEVSALLGGTRPTAVNLRWALERGRRVFEEALSEMGGGGRDPEAALLAWARDLHAKDVETNRRIGRHGAELFAAGDRVLTHCNAGALATAGYGTALGVIRAAWERERLAQVWVDETRPLLQGARLTAWELRKLGIPHRLVTDSSAGSLMTRGLVDRIVVGADRIAANGDTANKIGTYVVAVLARRHGVPFYVAAPLSTVDPDTPTGAGIPIEERAADEVTDVFGTRIAPDETAAANPAFDVTPAELVTAIVTEVGVLRPPYEETLARALAQAGTG
ncbi:MAG TPA: S-methyl-5-thioribose-1-phosphate isomerase [Thermoanaerobaculia bacterium]|nr:S-methyl-5-thioribose-1-phosphate isomerase [Thermoanaerobaculia bacterium]